MNYETLLFDLKDGVALITINRPDKLNALNDQVLEELGSAAERLATEDPIKGAILTGAGRKAFVAGADIGELQHDLIVQRIEFVGTIDGYECDPVANLEQQRLVGHATILKPGYAKARRRDV